MGKVQISADNIKRIFSKFKLLLKIKDWRILRIFKKLKYFKNKDNNYY